MQILATSGSACEGDLGEPSSRTGLKSLDKTLNYETWPYNIFILKIMYYFNKIVFLFYFWF